MVKPDFNEETDESDLVTDIPDNLITSIYDKLNELLFLLSKVDSRKAKRLKRFLSGMSIHGFK